ncbi:MAG: hypothetical protein ABIC95_02160 [archaeon]
MTKRVDVLLSKRAQEIHSSIRDPTILRGIEQKIIRVQTDIHFGNPIAKRRFPERYVKRYGITNLFRIELPRFWRMLYTLTDDDGIILVFIIDILDHKRYDKVFGYRTI